LFLTADWEDPLIKMWETATGKLKATLKGIDAKIPPGCWSQGTVAYSPDGRSFATTVGGANKVGVMIRTQLTIWDATTLKPRHQRWISLRQHPERLQTQSHSRVHAIAYSPDGTQLAVGGVGGSVRLLALTEEELREADQVTIRKLIAQLDDDEFAVRETAQRELLELGGAAQSALQTAAKQSKSREVQFRAKLILHRLGEGAITLVNDFDELYGTLMSVKFSPDGRLLAACSRKYQRNDGRISVWELSHPEKPVFVYNPGVGTNSLAFSNNGEHLVSAGQDGTITVWEITKSP